jgi:hypothetical protein
VEKAPKRKDLGNDDNAQPNSPVAWHGTKPQKEMLSYVNRTFPYFPTKQTSGTAAADATKR